MGRFAPPGPGGKLFAPPSMRLARPERGKFFARPAPTEDTEQSIIPGLEARIGQGSNIICLLMGRRGQGKTAFETAMLDRQLRAFEARHYPGRLYSNYDVSFFREGIDYFSPYLVDEIASFPPWLRKGYMALDEIQSAASSRRSMSKSNVNLSSFLTQMRHRNIEAIFTTQFPQVLDYQLLLQVDLFIRVSTIRRDFLGFPTVMRLEIFDYWGQWTGRDYRKPWPPQPKDIDASRNVFIPSHIRGTYDTHEIIASAYWDPMVRERTMIHEAESRGRDSEWLTDMNPAMRDAQDSHQDARGGKSDNDYDSLTGLLDHIALQASRSRQNVNLGIYKKEAERLSGGRLMTVRDLANEIKGAEIGVTVLEHKNNNNTISYIVEGEQVA